jgi:hypothetical protein
MKITRMEKKDLMRRLTPIVKERLEHLKNTILTYTEMTERTGLTLTRISELVNNRKDVNEIFIMKLLIGGIMKTGDFYKAQGMTKVQKEYLKGLAIYEDADLRNEVSMLKEMGENPAIILRTYRTEKYKETE